MSIYFAESVVDRASTCSDDVCLQTREQILAAGCAATCSLQPPSAPVRGGLILNLWRNTNEMQICIEMIDCLRHPLREAMLKLMFSLCQ